MWDGITWFFDELLIIISNIWNAFLSSFAFIIESIPVPSFLLNLTPFVIPESISFFAQAFQIQFGISIVVSAYTLRFFIRRLPIVG
ncbi:MAG: hypothetical protein COB50_04235 [Thiotrichales bacterium]|nr:MAG: hypothetical protein COB50_04235 [Thiotrichales bacterium]